MRILSHGVVVDDYVRITKSTSIKSLKRFVQVIVDVFRDQHLKKPIIVDIFRFLSEDEGCGFPRMLGSIDCMH